MKITQRQLRRIIQEAVEFAGYGQFDPSEPGFDPGPGGHDLDDYEQGLDDATAGVPSQDLSDEYNEGYDDGSNPQSSGGDWWSHSAEDRYTRGAEGGWADL
tara:strand:- start:69 stop:371 length:303 start_codon:yes stop_codon:yes gene_type:complete